MAVSDYVLRLVDPLLDEYLEQLPAVLVLGPRASGKSTTLARRVETVVRLDQENEAAAFAADPDAALKALPEPVLLDEWQNVPGSLGAVRRAVEADPSPGRFLVTGSVHAELENEVWPGTGRLTRLHMSPLTVRELLGRNQEPGIFEKLIGGQELALPETTPDLLGYLDLALASGFPMPALRLTGRPRVAWLESYIDDLLSHDLKQLDRSGGRGRDVQRLKRYFEAYALVSAGVVDHKTIYDAAGINRVTGETYDELFADLLIVERIPAWTSSRLKRLTRTPKRYLVDAALVAAAAKLDKEGLIRNGRLLGSVIDTFVTAQLRPELDVTDPRPTLFHLRTKGGDQEADLLAEVSGRQIIAFEIKADSGPGKSDAKHLSWLRNELGDDFLVGVVFHTGPRLYELADRVIAAPISTIWG